MNSILIRSALTPQELKLLVTEFPHFQIIQADPEESLAKVGIELCSSAEVFYGCTLRVEELGLLPNLHWIHCPTAYLDTLCTETLLKQENILITTSKEENIETIGEFALCTALSFTKCLFHWEERSKNPETTNLEELRSKMWSAQKCIFLQVGLGNVGTEIARRAKDVGFEVWGVQKLPSFHPHCKKTFALSDLKKLLPKVGIVCLAAPRDQKTSSWFNHEEFDAMLDDSAFMAFGNGDAVNLEALTEFAKLKKFRGVLLDAHFKPMIDKSSELWKLPYVIISEESSSYPQKKSTHSFHGFLYNLRQYLHGNFGDMRNLLRPPEG